MNAETMYTLGQLTRCAFPEGAPPDLVVTLLAKPATGLTSLLNSYPARAADECFNQLMSRLPPALFDSQEAKESNQGPFWLGYYHWGALHEQEAVFGTEELQEAGRALYGDRWQTDLTRELGLKDARRIRQWMSEDRPIPAGVWAQIAQLLRSRGFQALALASKFEKAPAPEKH